MDVRGYVRRGFGGAETIRTTPGEEVGVLEVKQGLGVGREEKMRSDDERTGS